MATEDSSSQHTDARLDVPEVYVVSGSRGDTLRTISSALPTYNVAILMSRRDGQIRETSNYLVIPRSEDSAVSTASAGSTRALDELGRDFSKYRAFVGRQQNPQINYNALYIPYGENGTAERLETLLNGLRSPAFSFDFNISQPTAGRRFPDAYRGFARVFFRNCEPYVVPTVMAFLSGSAWSTSTPEDIRVNFLRRPPRPEGGDRTDRDTRHERSDRPERTDRDRRSRVRA